MNRFLGLVLASMVGIAIFIIHVEALLQLVETNVLFGSSAFVDYEIIGKQEWDIQVKVDTAKAQQIILSCGIPIIQIHFRKFR